MRLINTSTYAFEEFMGDVLVRYAILSHTWAAEEVTYKMMRNGVSAKIRGMEGFRKIRYACEEARASNIDYCWVDTCCIDKRSSAELSEAINSMFRWYASAHVCYAYCEDVEVQQGRDRDRAEPIDLERARWFTRGWTLQELIAPIQVEFYGQSWTYFGERRLLADQLSRITSVDVGILRGSTLLKDVCVARRMSWASHRKTTRIEDAAYALLGIFGVNMPLLYGEGNAAFRRLQEAIIREVADDSILAWDYSPADDTPDSDTLFAPDPYAFRGCKAFRNCRPTAWSDVLDVTSSGITFSTYYIGESALRDLHCDKYHPHLIEAALLNCYDETQPEARMALRVELYGSRSSEHAYHVQPTSLSSPSKSRREVAWTRLIRMKRHGGIHTMTRATHLITRLKLAEDENFRVHAVASPSAIIGIGNDHSPSGRPKMHHDMPYVADVTTLVVPRSDDDKVFVVIFVGRILAVPDQRFLVVCEYQRTDLPPYNADDGDYGVAVYGNAAVDQFHAMHNYYGTRYDGRVIRKRQAQLLVMPSLLVEVTCNLHHVEGRTLFVQIHARHPYEDTQLRNEVFLEGPHDDARQRAFERHLKKWKSLVNDQDAFEAHLRTFSIADNEW